MSITSYFACVVVVVAISFYLVPYGIDLWYFYSAIRAEQRGDIDRAQQLLATFHQRWPDDPSVLLLSARIGWRSQLNEPFPAEWDRSARGDLKKAERFPEFQSDVALEYDILEILAGNTRSSERRLAARSDVTHPRAIPILEALVRGNLEAHRFDAARQHADELIRVKPDSALAYFWYGLALELSGYIQGEAETYYRKAVDLDPIDTTYQVALVRSLIPHKSYLTDLRSRIESWLKTDPDRTDLLPYYAEVLIDLGDAATARSIVERLGLLTPPSSELHVLRGRIEMTDHQIDIAEQEFRKAIASSPKLYTAHNYLAQCLTLAGKSNEAKVQRELADRIASDHDMIAKKALRVAAEPTNPRLRYELGILNLRSGEDRLGVFWIESALAIDPDFTPARETLAAYFKASRSR